MTPAWAQRREALLRDCIVSPDVFHQMVDRLGDFVVPYQHALETEVGQSHVHLYLEGLLSHLGRKVFQSCGSWSESSWTLPGSVFVRGCAMLLPAAVLWSYVRIEQPVAEGMPS